MPSIPLDGEEFSLADAFDLPDTLDPKPFRRPRNALGQILPTSGKPKPSRTRARAHRRMPHPIDAAVGRTIVDLAPLMVARGYISQGFGRSALPNLRALCRGAGVSERTAYQLLRRPDTIAALSLEVIARVCEWLQCTPAEWITYMPAVRAKRAALLPEAPSPLASPRE
jgi:DNA-binding Xre family transcriptional regulator